MWNKFINLLSALFTALNVGVALWFYLTTDEIAIPAHWEALESAWGYGRSWLILPLSALSVLIYLLLRYSRRHTLVNLPFAPQKILEIYIFQIINEMTTNKEEKGYDLETSGLLFLSLFCNASKNT